MYNYFGYHDDKYSNKSYAKTILYLDYFPIKMKTYYTRNFSGGSGSGSSAHSGFSQQASPSPQPAQPATYNLYLNLHYNAFKPISSPKGTLRAPSSNEAAGPLVLLLQLY
jgi:hypothetical protein